MALAHFHAGTVSRGAGRSAVDAAAYVLRANFLDQRTGTSYSNGRNAADAVHTFVWLPRGAPEQYRDAETLANYMESRETRSNSRTARTFEFALPHELTAKQREQLVKNFAQELTRKGLAVIAGIHAPHQHGDERNHHAHMVVSTRTMDANGLGAKLRELDKVETLEALRVRFGELTNERLERAGHEARIDMRSFERQGIEGTPQVHMGPVAAALERKGIETDRGDQWRSVKAEREQGREAEARPATVAQVEAVPVVSAVERQQQEDRQERREAQREEAAAEARSAAVPFHLRMMAAAMRFLRINSGGLLERTMGRVDDATIAASMREAKRERVAEIRAEKAAADLEQQKQHRPPPFSRAHAREETEPRVFVDRGNRPAPWRALKVELEGEHQQTGPANDNAAGQVWSHEKQAGTPDVVRDRAAGRSTPSEAARSETAPPAGPAAPKRRMTYAEELRAEQAAKGQTLADLLPKDYRDRQRQREREEGLGLDLEL